MWINCGPWMDFEQIWRFETERQFHKFFKSNLTKSNQGISNKRTQKNRVVCNDWLFTAEEFLYQNQWGEIALLSVGNLSERILMSNTTYVSIIIPLDLYLILFFLDNMFCDWMDVRLKQCWMEFVGWSIQLCVCMKYLRNCLKKRYWKSFISNLISTTKSQFLFNRKYALQPFKNGHLPEHISFSISHSPSKWHPFLIVINHNRHQ